MRQAIYSYMVINRPGFGSALWYGLSARAVTLAFQQATGEHYAPLLAESTGWPQFKDNVLRDFYASAPEATSHDTHYVMGD